MGRRLVIDTTIARAAGGDAATHPVSASCRDFLTSVLLICHKFAVTPDLQAEWRQHRSRFSSTWLTSMDARKKVVRIEAPDIGPIREKVEKISEPRAKAEMTKDLHLVAAASATDGLIVSMDEEARGLFRKESGNIGELKDLVWVNPCKAEDDGLVWLKDGAPTQRHRQLAPAEE